MRKVKPRILVASNSSKNRHHLLGQLVRLNYPTSCMTATDATNRQSSLRVARPDILLYDLCDEPLLAATSISTSLATRLNCSVLYVFSSWNSREYRTLNSGALGEDISYISINATPHELELAIENRILKSTVEDYSLSRHHEKWSFEAMASAFGQSLDPDLPVHGIIGILGTAVNACCALVREGAPNNTMQELASSGTRNELQTIADKRLSCQTMNWIRKFPYLQPQQIKNTKANIDIFDGELLWMPRSAIITKISPTNAPVTALYTWSEEPRHFSESDLHVASIAAIFLGVACASIDFTAHIPTPVSHPSVFRAGA